MDLFGIFLLFLLVIIGPVIYLVFLLLRADERNIRAWVGSLGGQVIHLTCDACGTQDLWDKKARVYSVRYRDGEDAIHDVKLRVTLLEGIRVLDEDPSPTVPSDPPRD